jgi:hypothetical protein
MRSLIAFPLLATNWRLKKHIEGGVHAIRITWGTDWACMVKCACDERFGAAASFECEGQERK